MLSGVEILDFFVSDHLNCQVDQDIKLNAGL